MSAPGALLTPESVRLENGSLAGGSADAAGWKECGLPNGGGGGADCVSLPDGDPIGATSWLLITDGGGVKADGSSAACGAVVS